MGQQQIGLKFLINGLQKLSQIQYTGELNIQNQQNQTWNLYFRLGRIIWISGGIHPYRRFRRQMTCYLPSINISELSLSYEETELEYWDYILLVRLFNQHQNQQNNIKQIIIKTILEVLFDISYKSIFVSVTKKPFPNKVFDMTISYISVDLCLKEIIKYRKAWIDAGLSNFSPNYAPSISHAEMLVKMVNPNNYANFVNLMNGKNTLRDLAVKMKKSELSISRSLLPYILKGAVTLIEVPDLKPKINQPIKKSLITTNKNTNKPLIACIDDSPQICQMMERIIVSRGLNCISITDSSKALSILMEHKPDLIFLDLVMPVVSGYEICTYLRRTSVFKKKPVIILSANEGLVDKVRTRIMGANHFINKPIVVSKVLEMIYKYLSSSSTMSQKLPEVTVDG
ncbi:MAG: response regulator [Calothrix sp. MO_167.B42]|nr:response regulator [Calothrix sp. MO_167.B42]